MSQLPDCPNWEYESYPQRETLIPTRIAEILSDLAGGRINTLDAATDTRKVHERIFTALTPANCEYYAGHYRGEAYRCLRLYEVCVPADPRVGIRPEAVAFRMHELGFEIRAGLIALDDNRLLTPKERLQCIVSLASRAFQVFLTIHPYANGNGHAGRFIIWSIMGRYGYWPRRWSIDPRPPDPPYSKLIMQCRNGDPAPLERYLLQTLIA